MLCDTDGIPKGDKKTLFQTEGTAFSLGSVGAGTVEMKRLIYAQRIN